MKRQEFIFADDAALQESLKWWKKALRIDHWDIIARIERGNGLNMPEGNQGRCEWTYTRNEALIKIMDHIDWDPTTIYPQDQEVTLVHELLHVVLSPIDEFEQKSELHNQLEKIIHSLSQSLVALKRGDV